jgi:hypothetical protein
MTPEQNLTNNKQHSKSNLQVGPRSKYAPAHFFQSLIQRPAKNPSLNRNLFSFAILLVLLGIGFGIYLISFFGLLLMIGAFLARSRPKTSPPPPQVQVKQQARRISPLPPRQAEPWAKTIQQPVAPPPPAPEPAATSQTPTFEVPIFPNLMFPSLSTTSVTSPSKEATTPKPAQEDELLQIGAILALLRFAFG